MSNLYPPEGRLLHTLREPGQRGNPVPSPPRPWPEKPSWRDGWLPLCTPAHDLVVQLGPFTGTIPREEAALGIREGTAREISILSRVGKPVSCVVDPGGGLPPASRRRAQELALNPAGLPPRHRASRYGDPPGRFWRLCRCRVRRGVHDRD